MRRYATPMIVYEYRGLKPTAKVIWSLRDPRYRKILCPFDQALVHLKKMKANEKGLTLSFILSPLFFNYGGKGGIRTHGTR